MSSPASAGKRRTQVAASPQSTASRSSPTPASPAAAVTRTPSARAAAAPRLPSSLTTSARRAAPPLKSPSRVPNGVHVDELAAIDGHDTLLLSLRRETDEKEALLVKVQNKEQQITTLTEENDNMASALNAAEARLTELYNDQERMEHEMASRIEVIEKLRTQVRELEKEKRETSRRYTEQAQTFEAERQSFYDNEQHLKSRIQSLTQARKVGVSRIAAETPEGDDHLEAEPEAEVINSADRSADAEPRQDIVEEAHEPAEMTALRMDLTTLSISHTSLQNTSQLLQAELMDLKRVNQQLQEENESYNHLLRERTLTGQFNPMHYAGSGTPSVTEDEDETDARSLLSAGAKSALHRVEEEDELVGQPQHLLELGDKHLVTPAHLSRSRRSRAGSSPPPHGESLGDLPITGPGLDLASELGRAENKDILEGRAPAMEDRGHVRRRDGAEGGPNDVEALRGEVKALKDANKALSLYASKILDRILGAEGFEHVLAVDYDKTPTSPRKGGSKPQTPQKTPAKPRPQSFFASLTRANSTETEKLPPTPVTAIPSNAIPASTVTVADEKRQRRSMSFDWRGLSLFGGDKAAASPAESGNPSLRPLTIRPGASSIVGARKLDTTEDDDDRRERERLAATMKLMGIDAPQASASPVQRSLATAETPDAAATPPDNPVKRSASLASRFSMFRSKSSTSSTDHSASGGSPTNLTTEALEQAEAVQSLASLDAREQQMSAELSQGKGSGFTEMAPRGSLGDEWRSRRSRRSAGGSGSAGTVWSAGLSRVGDDEASLQRTAEEDIV